MSELLRIARSKTDDELNGRLLALPADVQALQRQFAAKGGFASGNMLIGVVRLAQQSIQAQGAAVATHYTWAVREALTASQSWVRELAIDGADSLSPLVARASDLAKDAAQRARLPELAERLLADIESTHVQVRERIITALDAEYATKSRGILRKLGSFVGRIIKTGGNGP